MNARLRSVSLVAALVFSLPALAKPKDDVAKPVKTVISSVRYGKDLAALKSFGGEQQARFLLADAYGKATEAQRKEFIELFHTLFAKIAFPKIRDNFKYLGIVTYEAPEISTDTAKLTSTIVIDHPLKKQEIHAEYTMAKDKAGWKVVDVKTIGNSMLTDIRDQQVQPLLKEGGWDALLKAMREKNKELENVTLK